MPQWNSRQLESFLRSLRGATIVSVIARTVPAMRKTAPEPGVPDNPYWDADAKRFTVHKLQHITGVVGCRYSSAVNRQRLREDRDPNFRAVRRSWGRRSVGQGWGNRVGTSPLIEHHGKLYLEIKRQSVHRVEYRHADTDEPIDPELLEPYLFCRKNEGGRRQRLQRPVILRDFTIYNIVQLRAFGEVYDIRPGPRSVRPARKRAA